MFSHSNFHWHPTLTEPPDLFTSITLLSLSYALCPFLPPMQITQPYISTLPFLIPLSAYYITITILLLSTISHSLTPFPSFSILCIIGSPPFTASIHLSHSIFTIIAYLLPTQLIISPSLHYLWQYPSTHSPCRSLIFTLWDPPWHHYFYFFPAPPSPSNPLL